LPHHHPPDPVPGGSASRRGARTTVTAPPGPAEKPRHMTATSETKSGDDRLIAQNRRASHDYAILETVECALVLAGTEVKSLRHGKASLAEAWASIDNGEVWVRQMHIPPYEQGNRWNLDPVRARKLLLHRLE